MLYIVLYSILPYCIILLPTLGSVKFVGSTRQTVLNELFAEWPGLTGSHLPRECGVSLKVLRHWPAFPMERKSRPPINLIAHDGCRRGHISASVPPTIYAIREHPECT